jgi:hypothetical protein
VDLRFDFMWSSRASLIDIRTTLRPGRPWDLASILGRGTDCFSSTQCPLGLLFIGCQRVFPRRKNCRGVRLTLCLPPVPRLRMSGAILPRIDWECLATNSWGDCLDLRETKYRKITKFLMRCPTVSPLYKTIWCGVHSSGVWRLETSEKASERRKAVT